MTPTAETVIRIRGLARHYGPVRAVDGVDLDVHRGRILALLGPSGCGKTTTLRLLGGFERPDAGTIEVDDQLVASAGAWVPPEGRRIGMVFQDYALFPHLTVAANVAYGLPGPARLRRRDSRRIRVAEVLELVGLDDLDGRYPHELSGGQQQRVALARALAPNPAVVMLDEPFSNLDAGLRAQVRADVHRILAEEGATAIFVTHDQEEALSLADEVAVMHDGRLVQLAAPEQLYRWPANRTVAGFVGEAEWFRGTCHNGSVQTELGSLPLVRKASGEVEVLVRPEDIRVISDQSGDAVVLAREFYGHDQMVSVRLGSGRVVRVRLTPAVRLAPGDRCRLAVPGPVHAFQSR